ILIFTGDKMTDKRNLILDAMQEIMTNNKSSGATVSDVARQAGIAKGGVYYYFRSKDEIIDAVIERAYSEVIEESKEMLADKDMNTIQKLKKIFEISVFPEEGHSHSELLKLLSIQDNVVIHQKFSVIAAKSMTPVLAEVIRQGIDEGILKCDYPEQYALFILSMLVLSLDRILLPTDDDQRQIKLKALAQLLETGLHLAPGSFSYFYSQT
ncbi:MAG: TetR/AcrR family transcriptional regulator, partial [Candidatus Ornithomonoglobus sp.]